LLASTDQIQANSRMQHSSHPNPNGCTGGDFTDAIPVKRPSTETLDVRLRQIIVENGLTGDPSAGRNLPSIEDPVAQLGKKLLVHPDLMWLTPPIEIGVWHTKPA
jgi:hypothetical protein